MALLGGERNERSRERERERAEKSRGVTVKRLSGSKKWGEANK